MQNNQFNPIEIERILKSYERKEIINTTFRQSAVLMILYPFIGDTYSLIITKRTMKLNSHKGEMSFPGGRFEPENDENKIITALRESEEEINANRNDIKIIGMLDDFLTLTGYIITPVVGIAEKPISFKKSEDEVAQVFTIPIEFFLEPKNFTEQTFKFEDEKFPIYNFQYKDKDNKKYAIWGATAHILLEYLKKVYDYNASKSKLTRFPIEKMERFVAQRKAGRVKSKIHKKFDK